MKEYKDIQIPERVEKRCIGIKCDVCGMEGMEGKFGESEWDDERCYPHIYKKTCLTITQCNEDVYEKDYEQKRLDLCPKCFQKYIVEYFEKMGINFNKGE